MYRFTLQDALRLDSEAADECDTTVAEVGAAEWLRLDLERLGVDKEAILALVGGDADHAASIHLGLRIAEYQRLREAEAVPA